MLCSAGIHIAAMAWILSFPSPSVEAPVSPLVVTLKFSSFLSGPPIEAATVQSEKEVRPYVVQRAQVQVPSDESRVALPSFDSKPNFFDALPHHSASAGQTLSLQTKAVHPKPEKLPELPDIPLELPPLDMDPVPEPFDRTVSSSVEDTVAFQWQDGIERKIRQKPSLRFPQSLVRLGQEASVKAYVEVDSSGNVVKVEIAETSGYTDVDTAVIQALREHLFAPRTDSRETSKGFAVFKFKLEKSR